MKNKWLYLNGDGWSSFGDGMQAIAMTSWLYLSTGSAWSVGVMIAVSYLPALLFAPMAGVWADHTDAKRLAVWTDVGRAVVVLVMAAAIATGHFSLPTFYVLQMLLAFGNMLFKPASQALVKETFVDHDLVYVLTRSTTISEVMVLVGSGFSGWMSAHLPVDVFLLINACTFLLSALCNGGLTRVAIRTLHKKTQSTLRELTGGWTFLKGTDGMLYLMGLSVVSSWSLQMSTTLLAPLVYGELHEGKGMFALMDILFSIGGALAGLIVKPCLVRWGPGASVGTMIGMGAFSALLGTLGLSSVYEAAPVLFGLGLMTMAHMVMMHTLIQVNTPKEVIGRVIGLRSIIASATKITSALSSGWLVTRVGVGNVYVFFAIAIALILFTSRRTRAIPMPGFLRDRRNQSA